MSRVGEILAARCAPTVRPPPRWTVSEWADAERRLSSEASSQPGRWRTSRAPYQRGIMDAMNDPEVETVVCMKGAQIGWSEILLNSIGYFISYDPSPLLMLQPTLEMAEAFSRDRLAPMLRDSPALADKVADPRARDSGNTLLHKAFPGGHVTLAGANSPASLASRPIRVVLCDEVDRYPASAGAEGDPISLARKRTSTFYNRKILIGSTPTVKGLSRVELAFQETDQRYFHLPCPHCGHMQPLVWERIDFATAKHACAECGALASKPEWLAGEGQWIATEKNPRNPKARGFHLNELYSPWRKWEETIADFKAAQGNTQLLKTWVNTCLGESWEDEGESIDGNSLLARCEKYRAPVPADVLCLSAGVDVQRDRLEVETVGWGMGEESWSIDRRIFWGDPDKADVWEELDEYRERTWMHEHGHQLRIGAMCIDSGGSNTQAVYDYCRGKSAQRIYAIKGMAGEGRPVVSAPTEKKSGRNRRKINTFIVGVDTAKATVYARLNIKEPGPGYCHFGHGVNDEEYFAQLTAEKCITEYQRGFAKRKWVVTRSNSRNESLDCRVYAYAALKILQPSWARLAKQMAVQLNRRPPEPEPAPAPTPTPPPAAVEPEPAVAAAEIEEPAAGGAPTDPAKAPLKIRRAGQPRRRGGFVMGWR